MYYYNLIKNVILSRRFELSDMLRKIDTLWAQGDISDEQNAVLATLARENADMDLSRNLAKQVENLESRVAMLEKALKAGEKLPTPEPTTPDEPLATDEYPAWKKDHPYRTGDKVTHGGKRYVCQLPDYVDTCYWSPSAYPAYWTEA